MNVHFSTYPWAFGTPGGGERQLLYYFDALKRGQNNWKQLKCSLFDSWKPDIQPSSIIHYFAAMPSSLDFLNYMKSERKASIVLSPNFWPEPESWEHSGVFESIKTILWLADLIVVNSFIEEEALVRLMKIDSSRIAVVHNGVDDIFFEKVSPSLFRKEFNIEGKYVLNVANIEPRKNQLVLLDALQNFPDLKLVTIGGQRASWYAEECRKQGGDSYIHLPAIDNSSALLRSAISGCEFFAMPSIVETPSIASLEAAVAGVKVLTTELGSTKEYFGDEVVYVNPFDVSAMRLAIADILSASPSAALPNIIREKFTWKPIAESLVKAYSRVAGHSLFD